LDVFQGNYEAHLKGMKPTSRKTFELM